jgi:3-deoxy-manno-octulosonate cytidylyltransferase (CMP-KDO synthetase)
LNNPLNIIAVIPARYASTRFPAKLMQDLCGKTVILRTYEATVATQLFSKVFVVTDSDIIFNEIISNGGKAIMSIKEHKSGSDRIAEAIQNIDCDIVVNVQGDEPFVAKEPLEQLIQVFLYDTHNKIDLASLMRPIFDKSEIENPNNVKVIIDFQQNALYFSRSVIPFQRDKDELVQYMQHIGVYAFRKQALLDFYNLSIKTLEASEKLEQLRYLEYGKKIRMVQTNHIGVGIDTKDDLDKARLLFLNL